MKQPYHITAKCWLFSLIFSNHVSLHFVQGMAKIEKGLGVGPYLNSFESPLKTFLEGRPRLKNVYFFQKFDYLLNVFQNKFGSTHHYLQPSAMFVHSYKNCQA